MSLLGTLQRVEDKENVYWQMPKTVHYENIFLGINRQGDWLTNHSKFNKTTYSDRIITGHTSLWRGKLYTDDNFYYFPLSFGFRSPQGVETKDYIKVNGVTRDKNWFHNTLDNEKYTGDYGNLRRSKVPGIDFEGSDFSGANLSNTNFGAKHKYIASIPGEPVIYKRYLKWYRGNRWNHRRNRTYKSNFSFSCHNDANHVRNTMANNHPLLDKNKLRGIEARTLWTRGNGMSGRTGIPRYWPENRGDREKVPPKYNVTIYRSCMYRGKYEWISASTFNNIKSGGVTTNSNTRLPHGWTASGGYLLGRTADLRNEDISGITINNIDLSNAKLDGIQSKNLVGRPRKLPPNWRLFQLSGQNNRGLLIGPKANLQNTDLGDLDLSILSNNDLKYIKSGGTKGKPILPKDWSKRNGMLFGPKADLNGQDLTGTNLENTNLDHADLRESELTDVQSGGILGNPKLPNGYLLSNGYIIGPKVDLSDASLAGIDLNFITEGDINLDQATLSKSTDTNNLKSGNIVGNPNLPSGWKVVNKHLIAPGVNLAGVDFSDADLSGINLYQLDLTKTTLAGISSGNIKFKSSEINSLTPDKSLTAEILPEGWYLVNGYLVGPQADLSEANLTNADLSHTDLDGVDLSDAILDGVKSSSSEGNRGGKPRYLPKGWFFDNGRLIGPGADLRGDLNDINFSGQNITGIDLTQSQLHNIRSGNVTIDRDAQAQLPDGWHLRGGFLLGPTADLSNEILSNIILPDGIDLSNANLDGIRSSNLSGRPILPEGWKLVRKEGTSFGFLLGPEADLEDTNFFRTDLSDIDLGSLDLTNANLNGVRSKRTTGKPDLPSGWKLDGGYLLGPTADLSDRYLKGVDLSNVDLEDAILDYSEGYELKGSPERLPGGWGVVNGTLLGPTARVYNQSLINADLTGIDLSGADIDNLFTQSVTEPAKLPNRWNFYSEESGSNGILIGPGAHLKDITLSGNLRNYNFRNVRSSNITRGRGLLLPNRRGTYGIRNGHIVGLQSDLTEANLSGVDFFPDIDDISQADLSKVRSGGITTDPLDIVLPNDWNLIHGYLVGPGRAENNFKKGADLTDADFRQEAFESDHQVVDLSQSNLTGIISNNIKWDDTLRLRPGWRAHCPNSFPGEKGCDGGGFFLGSKVSLPKGADLSRLEVNQPFDPILNFLSKSTNNNSQSPEFFINLDSAKLVEVDLSSARIRKARFNDANMSGAIFQIDSKPRSSITDSDFVGTNLQNAFIGTANIADSDFSGADLTGAVISPSNLDAFNTNTFSTETICPNGTESNGEGCFGDQLII